jgi:hypothetical protein
MFERPSEAVEFLEMGTQLATKLTRDAYLARCCVAAYCDPTMANTDPEVDEMLPLARMAWTHLATGVLRKAVPYAWETGAIVRMLDTAKQLPPDRFLIAGDLPAPVGWWYLGTFTPTKGNKALCAFGWEATHEGVALFPFFNLAARWRGGFITEDQPHPIGPMAAGGIPIPYGLPLSGIDQQWPAEVKGAGRDELGSFVRFFLAGCAAITRGELFVRTTAISKEERQEIQRFLKSGKLQRDVRIVGLPLHE